MIYRWDPDKALSNHVKHGIDFADAVGVFADPYALTKEDPDSEGEQRFIILGMDFLGRMLVVVTPIEAIRSASYRLARPPRRRLKIMRDEYDFSNAKRGPVEPLQSGKTRITIRLDSDILAWFREKVNEKGGGNYQTMINDALRSYIRRQDDLLEETLRRVIREELRGGGLTAIP
jgi:uncharacterized DUF497 family protein